MPSQPDKSIVRQECGVCGADLGAGENCPELDEKRHCDGTTIERRYVAVDALLSDEAHRALCDPGAFCERLRSYPPGTRQMEPLERWQQRALAAALSETER